MTQTEPSKEPDNFHAYKTNTAKAERNRRRQILRDRIDRAASGIVDVAERIIDELRAQPPAAPTPPLAVARRQLANTLHLAHFCDNKTCRRARCCRGEPLPRRAAALPADRPAADAGGSTRRAGTKKPGAPEQARSRASPLIHIIPSGRD